MALCSVECFITGIIRLKNNLIDWLNVECLRKPAYIVHTTVWPEAASAAGGAEFAMGRKRVEGIRPKCGFVVCVANYFASVYPCRPLSSVSRSWHLLVSWTRCQLQGAQRYAVPAKVTMNCGVAARSLYLLDQFEHYTRRDSRTSCVRLHGTRIKYVAHSAISQTWCTTLA